MNKNHETFTNNPLKQIYVNKAEDGITFKIESGYYLELLSSETMELLGSKGIKFNQKKMKTKTTKVVLVHCNFVNNTFQHGVQINNLDSYWRFHHKILFF